MSAKGIVATAKSAISELRNLISTTHVAKNDISAALTAAESERRSLLSAPLNRADLEAVLVRDIAAQQADALANEELMADIRYTQTSAIKHQLQGDAASSSPFTASVFNQSVLDRMIFALGDPAEILKRLKPVIDRIDFKTAGPSMAERKTRLATLDKTIAGLRTELAEIDSVLHNADPTVVTKQDPRPGERRELSPGEWSVWMVMPHSKQGFWQPEGVDVFRTVPNQPFN